MQTKFEQVKLLVSQGKHKKALAIVKKINQKDSESNFESLALEIACLFFDKKYQLAYLKAQHLFKFAVSDEQKLSCLRNLAALSERLNKQDESISYLNDIMIIDSSLKTADQRFSLVNLAFKSGDYESVEKFGPLLSNLSKYSIEALLMLGHSAINMDEHNAALIYFSRLMAEMRVEGRPEIEQLNIISVLNGLDKIKAYKKEKELLGFLEPKFKHETWFNEVQKRLERVTNISKVDSVKVDVELSERNPAVNTVANKGVSGNSEMTVKIIKALQSELISMGASFHKYLNIKEDNDEISVTFAIASEKEEELMSVPVRCMPLVNDFQFSLDKNGYLVTKAKKRMMNPAATKLMQLLTQMYNACNKLTSWKKTYPIFLLSSFEDIKSKLFQSKSNSAGYAKYSFSDEGQISDDAVIKSFLGSRVLSFDSESLRKNKIKTKREVEQVFLPIIELINHKMGASTFRTHPNKTSIQTLSGIGQAGREVFVQYNLDDPLITFFTYGFVDTSAEWIYSVPLVVKTSGLLSIRIENQVKLADTEDVPNHLLGLVEYYPADISRQGNIVSVSKLIIPGEQHSHSLRAVLGSLLKKIDSEGIYKDAIVLDAEVDFVERQIIQKNKAYWAELENLINSQQDSKKHLPPLVAEQLNELCDLCLSHINRYYSQKGFMLKN